MQTYDVAKFRSSIRQGIIAGVLSIAPCAAHAVSVELVQHTASPFAFTVTKSDPSHSGTLNFNAFKYGSYGALSSTTLSVTGLSNWIYGYSPTASEGSFSLYTLATVDASQLGGPSDLTFGPEGQENVSWSGGTPSPVTLSGTEGFAASQTYTPGGAGSAVSYTYGWSADQNGATWDTLTESISGNAHVDYRFSIPVVLPKTVFNETFGFDVSCAPGSVCFYDPVVATGFTYEAIGTAFTQLMVPGEYGDGEFTLLLFNSVTHTFDLPGATFHSGETIDLTQFDPNGLTKLKIGGIEPSAGVDPQDQTGFVTGFSFASNTGSFTMAAEVASIPEPENWGLMLAGLGLVGWAARRRQG